MSNGSTGPEKCPSALTVGQRLSLTLVYSPPLSWHAPAARLAGVRITAAERVDPAALEQAESDSYVATRYFRHFVAWAAFGLVFAVIWAPVLGSLGTWLVDHAFAPVFSVVSAAGLSRPVGADIAFAVSTAAILVVTFASLAVIVVPFFLSGRRSIRAASSVVSLALHSAATGEQLDLSSYPRLTFALRGLLKGVRESA